MKHTQTKDRIVKALIELMSHKSLHEIFVKDIAQTASITRQTFYRHFKDKYDVINWYYDREIDSMFALTVSLEGIRKNLIIKLMSFKEKNVLFKNAYQYRGQNSLAGHEFDLMYKSISQKIVAYTGIAQENLSLELKCSIEFFCYGVIHMTIDWLNESCPIPCELFADILIQLMPYEMKSRLK